MLEVAQKPRNFDIDNIRVRYWTHVTKANKPNNFDVRQLWDQDF